jgi:hypothetical protein
VSNDGHCLVCTAIFAASTHIPDDVNREDAIVRAATAAYIEGLEDEAVAQRDRFCLTHRAHFDALLRTDPNVAIYDPFNPRAGT